MRRDLKKKKEKLRTSLPKPCINRVDISPWLSWGRPPRVYGGLDCLALRAVHDALYLLHRVQKCCLATVILPALTSAAARGTDNRVEFESEVLIFQLLHCGEGGIKKEKANRVGNKSGNTTFYPQVTSMLVSIENTKGWRLPEWWQEKFARPSPREASIQTGENYKYQILKGIHTWRNIYSRK